MCRQLGVVLAEPAEVDDLPGAAGRRGQPERPSRLGVLALEVVVVEGVDQVDRDVHAVERRGQRAGVADVAGHRVTETKGQVFGLVVRSRGLGGNLMAGLRSIAGGEIHEYTNLLEDTRRQAIDRMVQNATLVGANAVISMRFDSSELAGTMSEIVAYGTAVVIEPDAGATQPHE